MTIVIIVILIIICIYNYIYIPHKSELSKLQVVSIAMARVPHQPWLQGQVTGRFIQLQLFLCLSRVQTRQSDVFEMAIQLRFITFD